MATPQGDGSIILNTKVDTSGIKKGMSSIATGAKKMASTAGKAFLAIGAAASAATVAMVKSSVDAYAQYEQLVGGVETLFKNSSKKVLEYANEAYRTTGQSANEYMQNVTAFSASLLSAVGGDTEKAAEVANAAMISISDNVNKMGSSAESVQLAFQGFAKQQYMLLDNLKLGYGGTKTEMERLLKDAQAITGVEYNIDNLADVYTAIGVIQEKLGIAGTTAKEASTTISGSAATMKAAWQNVLAAISGGGDLEKAVENLAKSISVFFENLVPVIERALSGVGSLVSKIAPKLIKILLKNIIASIPDIVAASKQLIVGVGKGLYEGIVELFQESSEMAFENQEKSAEKATKAQEKLTKAVQETNKETEKSLSSIDEISILNFQQIETQPAIDVETLREANSEFLATEENLENLEKKSVNIFNTILAKIGEIWNSDILQDFIKNAKHILEQFGNSLSLTFEGVQKIVQTALEKIAPFAETIFGGIREFFGTVWSDIANNLEGWIKPILDEFAKLIDDIGDLFVPISEVVGNIFSTLTDFWNDSGKDIVDGISEFVTNLLSILKTIYNEVIEPTILPLFEKIGKLWEEHISPLIKAIGEFLEKVITLGNELKPIIDWIVEKLAPIVVWISDFVNNVFSKAAEYVTDALTNLINTLSGVIEWITDIFSGDWADAWEGIKETGKDVVNSFIKLFEDGVNFIIDAFNSISFDLPEWLGGGTFGINIPKVEIPKLAQGAVLPPNKPFLAMVGDQKQGINVETPLDVMIEAFQKALDSRNGRKSNQPIIIELNGRELGRAIIEEGRREERRIGATMVIK